MIRMNSVLHFTIIMVIFAIANAIDYCKLKSDCTDEGLIHTMCRYKSPEPAAECGQPVLIGLTQSEKNDIMKKHNELRQKVASGHETRGKNGPQPPAVKMPDLIWDEELEIIAQRWTNQCIEDHEDCNDVERFAVGQNIAAVSCSGKDISTLEEMIQSWYDEVDLFDKDGISAYIDDDDDDDNVVGHYTQLIWADTTKIGCGRIKFKKTPDGGETHLFICNYGPSGNVEGERIYEVKK